MSRSDFPSLGGFARSADIGRSRRNGRTASVAGATAAVATTAGQGAKVPGHRAAAAVILIAMWPPACVVSAVHAELAQGPAALVAGSAGVARFGDLPNSANHARGMQSGGENPERRARRQALAEALGREFSPQATGGERLD